MSKIEHECPVCGSKKLDFEKIYSEVQSPYGPQVKREEEYFVCKECGAETLIEEDTSDGKLSAVEQSKRNSIQLMIDYFKENNRNLASIERALELPQRTISRWKANEGLTASAIALLRILRTFPWIIDVADFKFNAEIANKIHIQTAVSQLLNLTGNIGVNIGYQVFNFNQNVFIYGDQSQTGTTSPNRIVEDPSVIIEGVVL